MKTRHASLLGLIGSFAIAGAAFATQPPDADPSDEAQNTAYGTDGLINLSSGQSNTAFGAYALSDNSEGSGNTAYGAGTLDTLGAGGSSANNNTAIGSNALSSTQSGSNNTATGAAAAVFNDNGDTGASGNTADGANALYLNETGSDNTATGFGAMYGGTGGYSGTGNNNNTAAGYQSLYANSGGSDNTAMGSQALYDNTTGSENIAVGYEAGFNVKTGSNNIEIGNKGAATDGKVIKIGTEGLQTKTIIAGIYNVPLSGNAVVITDTGQLGVASVSSQRFKTDIAPMGTKTEKLGQLRPVTFKLKSDAAGSVQYGLIAEEVAKVYPELVIRNEHGRIDGVRYDELAPMLLNEMQKERAQTAEKIDAQAARIASLEHQLAGIQAALVKLQPNEELVAQR
jgi:hypothetical protein